MERERVFITMVREDVFDRWGWPAVPNQSPVAPLYLSAVLKDQSRRRDLWLNEETHPITWDEERLKQDWDGKGMTEVGFFGDGGWGQRIYAGATPAVKASAWGPGGRTHLVAQRREGKWAAR